MVLATDGSLYIEVGVLIIVIVVYLVPAHTHLNLR